VRPPAEGTSAVAGLAYRGLAVLGFASVYREGFEVVLFLQSIRLQVGSEVILFGALLGLGCTLIAAVLTFAAHRRLPYQRMLLLTGILLGMVLLVMGGEQAQEMELAGWIPTTTLPLAIPGWLGVWFSVFPTVQTLVAQAIAALLVLGSWFGGPWTRMRARRGGGQPQRRLGQRSTDRPAGGAPPSVGLARGAVQRAH